MLNKDFVIATLTEDVNFDMTLTANYTHDSLSQRIGDDLAVAAKKAVGVLAGLVKGALEGTLFAVVRLGISAVQFLTKLIDPGATGVLSGLARSQAMLDLPTLSLICAGEWAKGQQPTGPDIGAFDNNTVEPLLQNKGDAKSVLSLGKSGVKLNEAITNYRQAHMDPTLAADYLQKIPTTSSITKTTTTNFITKTEAVVDVTWAGIGAAAALGDAIYSFVSDGPGIVWEDTAKQAWETGGDEYEACIMRHLSAVWPESIPNPDTGTAMPANASGPAE